MADCFCDPVDLFFLFFRRMIMAMIMHSVFYIYALILRFTNVRRISLMRMRMCKHITILIHMCMCCFAHRLPPVIFQVSLHRNLICHGIQASYLTLINPDSFAGPKTFINPDPFARPKTFINPVPFARPKTFINPVPFTRPKPAFPVFQPGKTAAEICKSDYNDIVTFLNA